MDTQTTSFAKEVTFDGEKANRLDTREGITPEFNNNSDPFIIQENAGRAAEGTQKGERSSEGEGTQGRETFNSAAGRQDRYTTGLRNWWWSGDADLGVLGVRGRQ